MSMMLPRGCRLAGTLRAPLIGLVGLLSLAAVAASSEEAPAPATDAVETVRPDGVGEVDDADHRIDLNTAGLQQLMLLPRVGPVVAQRIVDYRKAVGPFTRVEQLLNVKGIGERTLERMRPLVSIAVPPAAEPAAESSGKS